MRIVLILIIFCFSLNGLHSQSRIIKQLKEEEKVLTEYYLYPSTLRMINIQRDPAFDKLVKPIRRLSLMSMDDRKFDSADLQNTASQMIEEEAYETYAEMSGPDNNIYVLGKSEKEFTCVIAEMDSSYYIAEIQGKIDIMKLSEIYNSISQNDSTANTAFIDVFGLIGKDNDWKRERQRREAEWKRRDEERARKKQMKKDSLEAIRMEQDIEQ